MLEGLYLSAGLGTSLKCSQASVHLEELEEVIGEMEAWVSLLRLPLLVFNAVLSESSSCR